jgi:uncharacterized membrane protein (UPF0182 family)
MKNMFDDFLEELRRRQAEKEAAAGQPHDGSDDATNGAPASEGNREDDTMRSGGTGSDDGEHDDIPGPRPVFRRGGVGGGDRRYTRGPNDEFPEIHIGRGWIVLGVVALAIVVLLTVFALTVGLATDAIWFQSVGYASVFWTRLGSQILFFVVGVGVAFFTLWINVWLAGRFIPKGQLRRFSLDDFLDRFSVDRYFGGGTFGGGQFGTPPSRAVGGDSVVVPDVSRPVFWSLLAVALLIALAMGGLALGGWNTIQLFMHKVPFGQTDPTFGKDISFYLFELPFYRLVQSYAISLLFVALLLVAVRYLVAVVSGAPMPTTARVHLGALAALWLFAAAVGYQLDRYELVYSSTSTIFQGVSYADYNAKMVAINAMTVLTAFVGCFVLVLSYTRWRTPLALTIFFWAGAFLVLDVGYPQLVQRISVEPNQQAQESPYITNNIAMTRLAFGLTSWSSSTYNPGPTVTQAAVEAESSTMQNVRLWDYRPLAQTLDQLQVIRTYYNFTDVDTDRYVFTTAAACAPAAPPCVRQVMIAGRDFDPTKYAAQNSSDVNWVNLHISYTHGVGLAMVPVNEFAPGGQPNFLISNLPPSSTEGAPTITQPSIYFGTNQSNYVIVDAASQEFDYPSSTGVGGDAYTSWTGTNGIKLDTPLSRLLFAARFGDLNLLISGQITGSSQLLFNRSIQQRVTAIAPFLRLDKDPYLVITSSGRLVYVQDAFTTSAAFPDANTYDPGGDASSNGLAGDPFNYVRNSVKIVMDAYDGTMSFYVADPTDPIIQAWQGVFPGVFKPLSEMPSDIRGDPANPTTNPGHLRYPEDMFNAQTTMFEKYHVTDPVVFFKNGDVWSVPQNSGTTTGSGPNPPEQLPLEAYYIQMRMPSQASPEFLLLQPMAPSGRKNMIAWVAAHNDPANYGQVSVVDFPVGSNVLGPEQMESKVNSNVDISQKMSLLTQGGSQLILGNLLVIPLQDSLLYVEPVYLVSTNNPIPAFVKVVVGTPTQVVWGDSLQDALNQIYAGQGAIAGGGTPTPGSSASPGPSATPSPPAATPTPTVASTPTAQPSISLGGNAQQLIAEASQHYQAAQAALANKDLATYQKEMDIVGQLLAQLQTVVGTPAPSPSGQ